MFCPHSFINRWASVIAVSMESGWAGFISISDRDTAFVAGFTLCPCCLHNLVLKPPNSIGFVLVATHLKNSKAKWRALSKATTWCAITQSGNTERFTSLKGMSGFLEPYSISRRGYLRQSDISSRPLLCGERSGLWNHPYHAYLQMLVALRESVLREAHSVVKFVRRNCQRQAEQDCLLHVHFIKMHCLQMPLPPMVWTKELHHSCKIQGSHIIVRSSSDQPFPV